MTRLEILKISIDQIYNRDLVQKNGNAAFIESSFNKERPMAGLAAFLMHNGTCVTGPSGLYGIANNYDYAPGTEPYPGKEICFKIAEKIARSRLKIWGLKPYATQTNFKSNIRLKGDRVSLTRGLVDVSIIIDQLVSNIKYIMKTHPNFYFCGMYMESRIKKPNVCFPEEPQIVEPYIQTVFHFQNNPKNY